jgi:hypothetical protein
MPATPARVLTAIAERRQPTRDGKRIVFDEALSVRAVSSNGGSGFLDVDA